MGATLILSFSESVSLFIVGRLLQGLSRAVAWTVPLAIITNRVGVAQVGPYLGYMTLGRSTGMSAGPIFGGLVFLYWGYLRTYVTAFIILGIDIALRLLLILKRPQLTPSEKVKGKKLLETLYLLTTCQMWTAIWGSFQSAFICGALDSVLPLFMWHMYD